MNPENEHIVDEQFERKLRHAIHLEEREHLRSFIGGLESTYQQQDEPAAVVRPLQSRKWFLAAASLLLLAASYFTFQTMSGPSASQVAATYYEAYPNGYNPVLRSDSQPANAENLALSAYEAGNYKEALRQLSALPEPNENIRLFMAISAIETNDMQRATKELHDLRADLEPSHILFNPVQWYSGIVLLMQNDIEGAKPYFERLAALNSDSIHSRDSKKILQDLG